ncbi:MAG: Cardiolipin synthase [Candidatus Moranbacteria bacterium GW2011_GWC2_37_73]|nr:MAG: Cardiolipin synthetase [Parcubacteria group bacterium GW2011_GWC1_36_108]KKQ39645.1 MAG: Cardiolipin synthase [Candidatus Moranbacteria bacterium GW2011_GWC2_37_73]
MQYKLYTTSIKAWDAMLEGIEQAKKSVYLEMYIFERDTTTSHDFIGKLKQKARSGVRVIIVADAFGSKALKKEIASTIENSGIEFLFFSNWLRHIHRKILIVDERIAFVGGVNIGKRFTNWNDLQLKVVGRIAKRILRSFAYTYEMAGGKDKKILKHRERKFTAKLKFFILEHWPNKNIYTLKSHYIEKITRAQKSIQIASPYFTPPRWLISLLDDAIRRNVRVEILIPKKVDWRIMNLLNYRYMRALHPLGITFFLSRKMNHAKLLIIDGEEGLIGSQNMDLLSFQLNSEVGIFFKEKALLDELAITIRKWKQNSEIFKPQKYKMKFIDYVILTLLKILYPIL